MKAFLNRLSLFVRLLAFVLAVSILVGGSLTLVFAIFAGATISEEVQARLVADREARQARILEYFEEKQKDLIILGNSADVRGAFYALEAGFEEFRDSPQTLIRLYVADNPNPVGNKDELLDAGDGSDYSAAHARAHPFFRQYIRSKYFYDLFLIDLNGDIVYTVFKESDYATNLLTGAYKDTGLAEAFRDARSAAAPDFAAATDFGNYPPSNDDPAAFIATPIFAGNTMIGVLALQLPADEINAMMRLNHMSEHSAAYLVGPDLMFRTADHRHPDEDYILRKTNDADSVRLALAGASGVQRETNYRGQDVFAAYAPVRIANTHYAIIAEAEADVALAPLRELRRKIGIAVLALLVIVSGATALVARQLARPITRVIGMLSSSAREIAATVEQQEQTAQMQSASVSQTSATMEELGETSRLSAEQTASVSARSREAQERAEEGADRVHLMVASMEELKRNVNTISTQILALSEKNNQISDIINLVSDIAVQTNMLALNAAVEAARAGEYGKGFAVVAVEIRKLADESNMSAEKIQSILTEIRKATDSTVMAAEEGNKKAEASVSMGREVSGAFEDIRTAIDGVFHSVEQISLNIRQQSVAVNEIVQAMDSLNRGSAENVAGISQIRQGMSQVNDAARDMQSLVDGKS